MASIRPMPYPWRCMYALTSDCDGSRPTVDYEAAHVGLNTLGIAVGDSFWMEDDPSWAVNTGIWSTGAAPAKRQTSADAIEKLVLCGWVDALHSFTKVDADTPTGAYAHWSRADAQTYVDWLTQTAVASGGLLRRMPFLYDHHPEHNLIDCMVHSGGAGAYQVADLLFGRDRVRAFWAGDYIDSFTRGTMDPYFEDVYPCDMNASVPWVATLVDSVVQLNGAKGFGVPRYVMADVGYGVPSGVDVDPLFGSADRLTGMRTCDGFVNHFTHGIGTYSSGWQTALAEHQSGRICVTSGSRQVLYNIARDYCRWVEGSTPTGPVINVYAIDDPCMAAPYVPTVDELRGLTFYVDDPSVYRIAVNGRIVDDAVIQRNATDGTGPSIGIEWWPADTTDYTTWTLAQVRAQFDVTLDRAAYLGEDIRGYPRTYAMWPYPDSQGAANVAKNDVCTFEAIRANGTDLRGYVEQIHEANANALVLASPTGGLNCAEAILYGPTSTYAATVNPLSGAQLHPRWFLTEAGSTITSTLTSWATTVPVAEVRYGLSSPAWVAQSYAANSYVTHNGIPYRAVKACAAGNVPPALWDSATAYSVGAVVSRHSRMYQCTAAHTANDPYSTSGYWRRMDNGEVYWRECLLFRPGFAVRVNDEIMAVTDVDYTAKTLTVERGTVYGTALEQMGTRGAMNEIGPWTVYDSGTGYAGTIALDGRALKCSCTESGGSIGGMMAHSAAQGGTQLGDVTIVNGHTYTLTYRAKASTSVSTQWSIRSDSPAGSMYAGAQTIGTDWADYTRTITATVDSTAAFLRFSFGAAVADVWITDVKLADNAGTGDAYGRGAHVHLSGSTITTLARYWPSSGTAYSAMLDLRTDGTVADVGRGGERCHEALPHIWTLHMTTASADALAQWDGLFLDNPFGFTSGHINWGPNTYGCQNISPTNTPLLASESDAYYTTTYNDGLAAMLAETKAALGNKLLLGNSVVGHDGAMGALNGSQYEGVDGQLDGYGDLFELYFLGPHYSPNVSFGDKALHYADPKWPLHEEKSLGTSTNYRRMRFALGVGLLYGAAFCGGPNGHSSSGLTWFDEYDNGGQGTHYLGLPTGTAYRAVPFSTADLLAGEGDFA